jgi:hypothetical protein
MSSRDLTPNGVTLQLLELARQMQKLSDDLDELEIEAVTKAEDYTREYAKTYLDQSGPVEERKQRTLWLTQDVRLARDIADTMVKAHARKIKTLQTRIDIGRSAAALVRAEADALGIGGRARGG